MIKHTLNNLVIIVFSALILSLTGCIQNSNRNIQQNNEQAKPKQPNVLLIVADDMGYSDIGPFGGEIATPTLSELAKEGIQLTNFHVLPTCSPSRSVLLTGVDNHLAGIGTMEEFKPPEAEGKPGYEGYLNFNVAALPEVLKAGGYRTYMAGKWHLGDESNTIPHARGFDETFTLLPGGGSHWSDQKPLSPSQAMFYLRNGKHIKTLPNDFYSTKYYTDIILRWIKKDRNSDKPFFAYMSYTAPHDPLHAPKEYIDKYKGMYDDGWDTLREKRLQKLKELGIINENARSFPRLPTVKAWEKLSDEQRDEAARDMEVYAAMIDYLDGQIKRVIDHLKETGEYDNTLIIFFSDNGANGAIKEGYPGQTEEFLNSFDNSLENRGLENSFIEMGSGWAQASMAPSRMFKGFPAEGGIRSPLLIKLPGKMANAGSKNHSFLHINSIMPTILDIAKVEQNGQQFNGRKVHPIQGSSMLALLEGGNDLPVSEVGYELFGMKAYIADGWKILSMQKPFGTGDWELYNLEQDPAELIDLSKKHPDKLNNLVSLWEKYKKDNGVLDIALDLSNNVK
jgi:arylsulfatase